MGRKFFFSKRIRSLDHRDGISQIPVGMDTACHFGGFAPGLIHLGYCARIHGGQQV